MERSKRVIDNTSNLTGNLRNMNSDAMRKYAKRKYADEYDLVLIEEQEIEKRFKSQQESVDRAELWVESLKAYSMVPKLDKAIVDLLIEKIIVFPDNTFHIVLNFKDPYKDFAFLSDYLKIGGRSNGRSKKAI